MQGMHTFECISCIPKFYPILTKVMKFFLARVLLLFLVISNGQSTKFGIVDNGEGFCTKSSS